jgi:hypothetical protein
MVSEKWNLLCLEGESGGFRQVRQQPHTESRVHEEWRSMDVDSGRWAWANGAPERHGEGQEARERSAGTPRKSLTLPAAMIRTESRLGEAMGVGNRMGQRLLAHQRP